MGGQQDSEDGVVVDPTRDQQALLAVLRAALHDLGVLDARRLGGHQPRRLFAGQAGPVADRGAEHRVRRGRAEQRVRVESRFEHAHLLASAGTNRGPLVAKAALFSWT